MLSFVLNTLTKLYSVWISIFSYESKKLKRIDEFNDSPKEARKEYIANPDKIGVCGDMAKDERGSKFFSPI